MARAASTDEGPPTVEEFEAWHRRQPDRWEFIDGRPRSMPPASMRHSLLKRNMLRSLDHALAGGRCEVLVAGPQILTDEISSSPRTSG